MSKHAPIVLLNGWGMAAQAWQSLRSQLASFAPVIELDSHYQGDVDDFCQQHLNTLPEYFHVLGWSLGAMLALRMAALAPTRVKSVVSLAANAKFVADASWPAAMSEATFLAFYQQWQTSAVATYTRFLTMIRQGDAQAKQQRQYLQAARASLIDEVQLSCGLRWLQEIDNRHAWQSLNCPALAIFGAQDTLVPSHAACALQHLCPKAQVVVLAEAGHLLHYPKPRIEQLLHTFYRHE